MSELWAITVALSHEAKGLLATMKVGSKTQYGPIKVYEGQLGKKDCLLVQTGMGPHNAQRATEFLVREFPVTHVLSTGYCGALIQSLKNSDAVLATSLLSTQNDSQPINPDPEMAQTIQRKIEEGNIPIQRGTMITSEKPVLKVKDKEDLGKRTGAIAVDMESYSVLKALQGSKNIASLALRFVVDALEDDLTATEAFLDPQTGFQPKGLVGEVFRRPKILMKLPGLERNAHRARKRLVRSIHRIFDV